MYKSVPFTEKQPRRPETDTKNGFEDFPLAYSVRKNRDTFSDVQLLPEIFRWNDSKNSNLFTTFQQNFRETFCKCIVVFILSNHLPPCFHHVQLYPEKETKPNSEYIQQWVLLPLVCYTAVFTDRRGPNSRCKGGVYIM